MTTGRINQVCASPPSNNKSRKARDATQWQCSMIQCKLSEMLASEHHCGEPNLQDDTEQRDTTAHKDVCKSYQHCQMAHAMRAQTIGVITHRVSLSTKTFAAMSKDMPSNQPIPKSTKTQCVLVNEGHGPLSTCGGGGAVGGGGGRGRGGGTPARSTTIR